MVTSTVRSLGLLCKQLAEEPSLIIKQEIVHGFLRRFSGDVGLLLKLLLPKYAGRVYYTQEKQLLRALSIIFQCPEQQLREEWNRTGCIGEVATKHFTAAPGVTDADGWCSMALAEFDQHLDHIAGANTEEARVAALRDFFRVACGNAVYYFFREIKLDLRLGAGLRVVLGGLDPQAYTVFQQCANVQEVVKRVAAGGAIPAAATPSPPRGVRGSPSPSRSLACNITVGMPLAPMLAAPARSIDQILAKCPNGVFSEVKYDGERIQIHKKGKELTCFARSLNKMNPYKYAGLETYMLDNILADECVLDGEILMVDIATSVPLPFGTLGSHKRSQFATACPCVFLFDIMYKDGQSTLSVPLKERRQLLKQSVRFVRNRMMFSELALAEGSLQHRRAVLERHLNRAIAEGLEGLVLKDVNGVYEPRARHWLKIKKDYLDGLADSADLLVLGAWYGSGSRGGTLSSYLMGCIDEGVPIGEPGRFKTVCKVGNGLDETAVARLTASYAQRMRPVQRNQGGGVPSWLDCGSTHVPDVVLHDPATADVMEVIGAELSKTKAHTAGVSIRFPRVLQQRTDKDAKDATTLQELLQLVAASREKYAAAGVEEELHLEDDYVVALADGEEEGSRASIPREVPTKQVAHLVQPARLPGPRLCFSENPAAVICGHAGPQILCCVVCLEKGCAMGELVDLLSSRCPQLRQKHLSMLPLAASGDVELLPMSGPPAGLLASIFLSEGDTAGLVDAIRAVARHGDPALRSAPICAILPRPFVQQLATGGSATAEKLADLARVTGTELAFYDEEKLLPGLRSAAEERRAPSASSSLAVAPTERDSFACHASHVDALLAGVEAQLLTCGSSSAAAVQVALELMGGRCVAVGSTVEAACPCTHIIVCSAAHAPAAAPSSCVVVSERWLHDCLRDRRRYAEVLYPASPQPPASSLSLDGYVAEMSESMRRNGGERWASSLENYGATPADGAAPRRIGCLFLTDTWDASCKAYYEAGGIVVHLQWLLDSVEAGQALPPTAYAYEREAQRSTPSARLTSVRVVVDLPEVEAALLQEVLRCVSRVAEVQLVRDVRRATHVLQVHSYGYATTRSSASGASPSTLSLYDLRQLACRLHADDAAKDGRTSVNAGSIRAAVDKKMEEVGSTTEEDPDGGEEETFECSSGTTETYCSTVVDEDN